MPSKALCPLYDLPGPGDIALLTLVDDISAQVCQSDEDRKSPIVQLNKKEGTYNM